MNQHADGWSSDEVFRSMRRNCESYKKISVELHKVKQELVALQQELDTVKKENESLKKEVGRGSSESIKWWLSYGIDDYVDYREPYKKIIYKGVNVYLGEDSPRQTNKKKIMCDLNGKSIQLSSGSGWRIWIKDGILYTDGDTIDKPSIYIIDQSIHEFTKWKSRSKLMNEPYIKELLCR